MLPDDVRGRVHREFDARYKPLERASVLRHHREIQAVLRDSAAIAIAGGHVATLLNRLELFSMDDLATDLLDPLFTNMNEVGPPARGARSASPLGLPHGASRQSPDAQSFGGTS